MKDFDKTTFIKKAIETYNRKDFENDYITSYTERLITEVVKNEDEVTKDAIKKYFIQRYPKDNLQFRFLDQDKVDKIIELGIAEYIRREQNEQK